MNYAIIHRPEVDSSSILDITSKYDPQYNLVGPHITLVFPFNVAEDNQDDLIRHIQSVAKDSESFEVRFHQLELSWDQWLFLTASTGSEQFSLLHDELYTGFLKKFLRSDIEYIPHIALGLFTAIGSAYNLRNPTKTALDEAKYRVARQEIGVKNLDISYRATKLELLRINDEFSRTETVETFELGVKRSR